MPAVIPFIPLITGGLAAGVGIAGQRSARNAGREAADIEGRYTDQALGDARTEREYDRRLESDRLARELDDRSFSRSNFEREYGYRSSRDSIEDARYGEERDYERARYGDERDYGRKETANYQARLEPFRQVGVGATQSLGASVPRHVAAATPTMGGAGMVRLRAPNGQVSEVPAGQAEFYLQKGAVKV